MAKTPITVKEYFELVGSLIAHASVNEMFMFNAFHTLSGCKPLLAASIFYTLDSFPGKKNLLLRVLSSVGDEQDKVLINGIISASEKSNKQRRVVAHSMVFVDDTTGKAQGIITPKTPDKIVPVSKEWSESLIRLAQEALVEGRDFHERLCAKYGVSPIRGFSES